MRITLENPLDDLEQMSFILQKPMYSFEELLYYFDDWGVKYHIRNDYATLELNGIYFHGLEPNMSWRQNIIIAWRNLECYLDHKLYKVLEYGKQEPIKSATVCHCGSRIAN